MELRSQKVRELAPEMDPLRMGMGWKAEELSKPQIIIESTYGNSHPGSSHLNIFVEEAVKGVDENGGKAARYYATDMCDGMSQGHDGINYSLAHRDAITNLVEAQANATTFDGGVFIASCDKAMPAMLMSIGRLKEMSAIVVTGGVMEATVVKPEYVENDPGCKINELLTLEQIGKFSAQYERGEIPEEQLRYYKHNACPSCGACSFMGTASTMQVMAEALGLMLPGTALMPATAPELKKAAYDAGKQLMKLVEMGIAAKDIVTMESLENAIMVHAAISGSTNAVMHIPAIAHEFGFEIDADTFDRMHRGAHYLLNIRPAGDWPAQYFYYAGGVPRVMEEIKSMLHLDVMTVTGKTLGENLEELKKNGFYEHCDAILKEKSALIGKEIKRTDIIADFDHAIGTEGSIAILRGNLAPEGAVIKHTACPKEMFHARLNAKPYDSEEEAIAQMKAPLPLVDILKVSDEELPLLTGTTDCESGTAQLAQNGIRLIFVTLGANGVFYRFGEKTGHVAGVPCKVGDTNGAGDTFFGAALSKLCKEDLNTLTADKLESILAFANKAASITTSRRGAIPAMPILTEVEG
mgnify:CR=1 FL=1